MQKQGGGGATVNMSSVAGLMGGAGTAAYVSSKHGVIGLGPDLKTLGVREDDANGRVSAPRVCHPLHSRMVQSGSLARRRFVLARRLDQRQRRPARRGTPRHHRVCPRIYANIPDLCVTLDDLLIEDGQVVYHWTLTGTNTAPGGTRRRVHIGGFEKWTLGADNLIVRSLGHFDGHSYAHQLQHGYNA